MIKYSYKKNTPISYEFSTVIYLNISITTTICCMIMYDISMINVWYV